MMNIAISARVTATANLETGEIAATALLPASPERVFRALSSSEICNWWVRPGVFDTREWRGDLRRGGRWEAGGLGGGQPYRLEGEFLEIDAPVRLVHTWHAVGAPPSMAIVAYHLEAMGDGTRVTLSHSGLKVPDICEKTRAGWETSFKRLFENLDAERAGALA